MPEDHCRASHSVLTGQYVDIQVNGYAGVDFNDPQSSTDAIARAASAMERDGVARALPTIITSAPATMLRCIENVRRAMGEYPVAKRLFGGLHIEGPFLSPVDGYIGAHPKQHAQAQDLSLLEQLLEAGDGLVKLLTLAPEIDQGGSLTALCRERGVAVAAGHTDASLAELEICIERGLSLFTHLGNGCPRLMDRHDNIIYRALRCHQRLSYSLIADSFHIPRVLFENLLHWLTLDQIIIVSDAISAAGLGPGTYQLAGRQVAVGADRAVRDPGGEHFVGAACSMQDADRWLDESLGLALEQRRQVLVVNPQRFLDTL